MKGTQASDAYRLSGNGATTLDPGEVDDILYVVGSGAAYANTGGGDDTIVINDTRAGTVYTKGAVCNDVILGGAGANYEVFGAGSDLLGAGTGSNALLGGIGDDTFSMSFSQLDADTTVEINDSA
ncbi:hypothetical protein [Caulobacter sp. S45]|uniref:hypothetical protein n=1 Tax=Caulobacter sp. S45 TaxID=1641861 RepID=UPI00157636FE|nr:hypothetical protein [Caulobacter sp. S45]